MYLKSPSTIGSQHPHPVGARGNFFQSNSSRCSFFHRVMCQKKKEKRKKSVTEFLTTFVPTNRNVSWRPAVRSTDVNTLRPETRFIFTEERVSRLFPSASLKQIRSRKSFFACARDHGRATREIRVITLHGAIRKFSKDGSSYLPARFRSFPSGVSWQFVTPLPINFAYDVFACKRFSFPFFSLRSSPPDHSVSNLFEATSTLCRFGALCIYFFDTFIRTTRFFYIE